MRVWRQLAEIVAGHGAAALVVVHRAQGSTPREAGAALVVRPDGAFHGTIGGGRLEWEGLREARAALAEGRGAARFGEHVLGPDLGQCCGGRVTLRVETFDLRDAGELARLADAEDEGETVESLIDGTGRVARRSLRRGEGSAHRWTDRLAEPSTPLLLFGAGHVGRALALALAPLPFALRWIDGREDAFPTHVPANATPIHAPDPPAAIASAPSGAFVLVMTHDHALDLAVTAAALRRADLPFVGLIGLSPARVAALACPIGLSGIAGKEPAVIAASVAAQLLAERTRVRQLLPTGIDAAATA